MTDYRLSIQAAITPGEPFARISRVTEWWSTEFKGASQRLGDAFTVRFGDTFVDFRIAAAVPGESVVWQVTDCNLHWLKDKRSGQAQRSRGVSLPAMEPPS